MRSRKLKLFPLFVVLILSLLACTGATGTEQGTTAEKVNEDSTSNTQNEEQVNESFNIGDQIKLGDYQIEVATIEDPYVESNEYSQPEGGNKYVSVEVVYTNNTSDKTLSYNPYDWTLYDADGYNYDQAIFGTKDPDLSSGDLNPGKKVRGWITFEVTENSNMFTIQFSPDFFSNDNVEIELY